MSRLSYWRRIAASYLFSSRNQLTFWHETPEVNPNLKTDALGEYYMTFAQKADYPGPFDPQGVPQLDYHGAIGLQYNPIAVAQYSLANFNLHARTSDPGHKEKCLRSADWLRDQLEVNPEELRVWNHHFDWEYRTPLKAPWYSGLAQGQGVSALLRAHALTGNESYLAAARDAFEPLRRTTEDGGVLCRDAAGYTWIEEYLVTPPPTHILNGFLWALWGVHDFALVTGDPGARDLFRESIRTLRDNLPKYDAGFWSLYEQSGTWMRMIASPFYHRLHIVQLRVMHLLTGEAFFRETADRWEGYARVVWNRARARVQKAVFKICFY